MSRYAQDLQGNLILIAGNADYDVIAPKETSPATAPHTKGSRIFYGNALYEVTADIAVNDALVVGTNITASDDLTDLIEGKVDKTDLTSIIATGTTNTTGSPIAAGKYFYLNGEMVRATATITNNEAFTLNTNYEEVPTGGLNDLKAYTNNVINGLVKWENVPFTSSVTNGKLELIYDSSFSYTPSLVLVQGKNSTNKFFTVLYISAYASSVVADQNANMYTNKQVTVSTSGMTWQASEISTSDNFTIKVAKVSLI